MEDQRVGGDRPFLLRQRGAQLLLDDYGVVALRDADAVGDAQHVAIDGQAGDAERMAEDDVRRLAADAGQAVSASIVAGISPPCSSRPPCAMPSSDFDFARKKPVDWICGSSSAVVAFASALRVGIALEERRRYLVDALVGALRRQDGRDQQLVRRRVVQLGIGAGMLAFEGFS